jgi:hypothetical protein
LGDMTDFFERDGHDGRIIADGFKWEVAGK